MNATQRFVESARIGAFPDDAKCLKTFMFDRCRTIEECRALLEFYSQTSRLPTFEEGELMRAVEERRLVDYLLRVHKPFPSLRFSWFKLNLERWLFGGA